jgi:hypothetical protein
MTQEHLGSLAPVRGLILARTRKAVLPPEDLERWMRLSALGWDVKKADLLCAPDEWPLLPSLLASARQLNLKLSLRAHITSDLAPPEDLPCWAAEGLLDVHIALRAADESTIERWAEACAAADLALRLTLLPPFPQDASALADTASRAQFVSLALYDSMYIAANAARSADIERMQQLARALMTNEVDAQILNLPFCQLPGDLWPLCVNTPQFHRDHAHYAREPYAFARRVLTLGRARARTAIFLLLGLNTAHSNPIDRKLFPWMLDRPWLKARLWAGQKATRYIGRRRRADESAGAGNTPPPLPNAECAACCMAPICDKDNAELRRCLPNIELRRQEGPEQHVPEAFLQKRPRRWYDSVDAERLQQPEYWQRFAKDARRIMEQRPPDQTIDSFSYQVEDHWSQQLAGVQRWFSWTGAEQKSTPLARLQPPFTFAFTVGGGFAEYAGFRLGREAVLVCPMTAHHHRITLHAEEDGRYVLLRDEEPVEPSRLPGLNAVPPLLPDICEPRISLWNIDGNIGTQGLSLWLPLEDAAPPTAKISVVIVCTRFARRLEAVLLNLAHQKSLDPGDIEVVLAYVPGLDAVGDVVDSLQSAFPDLRVVRAPFDPRRLNSKGFMINECARLGSGEWIVLLDADILVAPGFLAELLALPEEKAFAFPDGRKMLSREMTAQVLLGRVRPWEAWDELLTSAGEYRRAEAEGVPVGFCQCVRRRCFEQVRYEEVEHFEGADWQFGIDMRERFGQEHRISGMPVIHLDHGASNWYGTPQHR